VHGFIKDCPALIATHPDAAYLAIFLVALSESLAILGILVPGTVIMVGVRIVESERTFTIASLLTLPRGIKDYTEARPWHESSRQTPRR